MTQQNDHASPNLKFLLAQPQPPVLYCVYVNSKEQLIRVKWQSPMQRFHHLPIGRSPWSAT
ncbi:hypothetical protein AGABI1DRAFT_87297 [Agaricus bisporus var. burnettii JB137-S8]|uniref:Uncharacterized protein n=1 Tax=Agaricus bisporus var. burnettii (strain JB137-S8 / ATCC MYA-4627 / FGSC 10392) TaxID=597362 RepID=K5WZP9_AGABU|nr:uncharacterized protein AGABI1DRAFT_87297 [Agaricus bisporus var. burnettii JB137-S8]EKM76328.1 hypothetical protein AGABI1DRAFT_87297 [Agaricus bisporus var. burnettii JB137-S8]